MVGNGISEASALVQRKFHIEIVFRLVPNDVMKLDPISKPIFPTTQQPAGYTDDYIDPHLWLHTFIGSFSILFWYPTVRQQCLVLRNLETLLIKYNYPLIAFSYFLSQRRMQHPNNSNFLFIEWNDHRHIIQMIQKSWFQNPFEQSWKPLWDSIILIGS